MDHILSMHQIPQKKNSKLFAVIKNAYVSSGSEVNLITVQQDATYSVYYISVGSSTCFGC